MRYAREATTLAAMLAVAGCVETRPAPPPATMCTMDAKQCPDGSYVGRSGPDCAFVCPKPADGGMSAPPGG